MKQKISIKSLCIVFVIIVVSAINLVSVVAITNDGFCVESDINPPNKVLFSFQTGVVSNPDNIPIYACCANVNGYIGAIFVTPSSNYSNVVVKNFSGNINYIYDVTEKSFNGITLYFNTGYMGGSGQISQNHYSYAEFDSNLNPTNSIANNFIDYVVSESGAGGNTPIPKSINYDLPSGNIAIIETNSSYSYINLKSIMPLQSTSFSNNPWPNTTQRIGFYNTLPLTISPNSMGNTIEWERNGNTTLFNVTTSAKYNHPVVSTFKYVVIANPYYYPANDMEDRQFTNGAININMDGVVNITVKSLTATVNMQTGEVEDNYNGEEWTGEIDETTNDIIWTDGNGDNNAPTTGGNLSDPSITGFQSWLKGILNNIVNIFEPAHDAISTLSGAVSNFASWLYALYVWLPSPILSLLTSAISLAIVIGIIKVFI